MKVCSRCHIEKDESLFPKSKQTRDGLFTWCVECRKNRQRERNRERGVKELRQRTFDELPTKKKCTRCLIIKSQSEFGIKKESKKYWTLTPNCKKCLAELATIRYNLKKNNAAFKKQNCERVKKYRDKNIDEIMARKDTPEWRAKKA